MAHRKREVGGPRKRWLENIETAYTGVPLEVDDGNKIRKSLKCVFEGTFCM